ncbi:PRC-barrel domain-containing protein [Halodurantibacterium flavum]|uniref:PRC-barrel domain-containing protein n=1 Tax=Halodurantibacterium flavum TaxID=1382802 RepID=A0ABW4S432_9RHOB
MKRIMLSTALVALAMTPAVAQTAGDTTMEGTAGAGMDQGTFYVNVTANDIFASDFIGRSVYVTQSEVQGARFGTGAGVGTGAGTGVGTGYGADGTMDSAAGAPTTAEPLPGDTAEPLPGDTAATDPMPQGAGTDMADGGTAAPEAGGTELAGDQPLAGETGTTTDTAATDPMTTPGAAGQDQDFAAVDGIQEDWEEVGSIDDVIMSRDGEVQAVLVDVGGFLGMGARTVAVDVEALRIVNDAQNDDFYVVFTSSRDELEAAPEFDRDMMAQDGTATQQDATMGTAATTTDTGAADPMATDTAATGTGATATDPALGTAGDDTQLAQGRVQPQEGYGMADPGAVSVDDLTNANLYDANNDNVANINDVIVGTDGQIEAVIADVGGFLGIGTHTVSLDFQELEIHRDDGGMGTDLRVYVPMTREQLEAMPEYQAQN